MRPAVLDSPYKGLVPYAEEDADLFFGREAEREIIAANLLANRLTLLYGPSGVGKSSVLQAGVVHDLRQRARRGLARHGRADALPVVVRDWADDPEVALLAETRRALEDLLGDRAADLPVPHERLSTTLEKWSDARDVELLLVLDQFEEYFTYGLGHGRHLFADEIAHLVSAPLVHVRVLIAIREDALARLDAFKGRIPGLFDNYLRIEHLSADAARAAIVRPVERFNELNRLPEAERRSVDADLVEAVIAQVRSGEVTLSPAAGGSPAEHGTGGHVETPYLQLVMDRLWRTEAERGSRVLRRSSLVEIGGAEQIVRTHVGSAMSALDAADQDVAAAAFHYLVTPSGQKMAHSADDLAGYTGAPVDRLAPLLERLCSAPIRILRPQPVPGRPDAPPRWEIVHDVLAHAVLEWGSAREHEREAAERAERARREERERHQRRIARIRRLAAGAVALALVPIGLSLDAKSKAEDRVRDVELEGVGSSLIESGSGVYQVSLPKAWSQATASGSDDLGVTFTARDGGRLRIIGNESFQASRQRFTGLVRSLGREADRPAQTGLVTSIAGRLVPWAELYAGGRTHVVIRRGSFVLHGEGRDAKLIRSVTNFAASSFESLLGQLTLSVERLASTSQGDRWKAIGTVLNGSDYEVRVRDARVTRGEGARSQVDDDDVDCPAILQAGRQCAIHFGGERGRDRRTVTLEVRGEIWTDGEAVRFTKRARLVIGPKSDDSEGRPRDSVVVAQAPEDAGSAPVTRRPEPGSPRGSQGGGEPRSELPTTVAPPSQPQAQPAAPESEGYVAPPADEAEVVSPSDSTPQDKGTSE